MSSYAQLTFEYSQKDSWGSKDTCKVKGTEKTGFGGISGIEHLADSTYVMVSDDPSKPWTYKAVISKGSVKIIDSMLFYRKSDRRLVSTGLESVRIHPITNDTFFLLEQVAGKKTTGCVYVKRADGKRSVVKILPDNLKLGDNKYLEGMCFSPDGSLFLSSEVGLNDTDTLWIFKLDDKFDIIASYGYKLDKAGGTSSNYEVSEIAYCGADSLLILERVFVDAVSVEYKNGNRKGKMFARVRLVTLKQSNPKGCIPSLKDYYAKNKCYTVSPITVIDLDALRKQIGQIDNLEGMTLGYPIEGKRSLVLVSDDNFCGYHADSKVPQVTQVLVFKQK
jgi:hypothetical protein